MWVWELVGKPQPAVHGLSIPHCRVLLCLGVSTNWSSGSSILELARYAERTVKHLHLPFSTSLQQVSASDMATNLDALDSVFTISVAVRGETERCGTCSKGPH